MRQAIAWVAWVSTVLIAVTAAPAVPRPNVLLIIADDLCFHDVGFNGNRDVRTPHLDQLRAEGVQFTRMYSPSATCTPCRSALLTGLYNVRSGAYPNHSDVRDGTRSLFTYLRSAGYRVALQAKADVRPTASFPFDRLGGPDGETVRNAERNADDLTDARAFVTAGRADQPWLLVFGSHDPHDPWTRGPRRLYHPNALTVPPYLHDDATTREQLAHYYAEVSAFDEQVGHLNDLLADTGQSGRTLVVFVSEQGNSFPFGGKWTLTDTGIRSAAVARWPGVIRPGSTADALCSYVDLVPTVVAAAGIDSATLDTGCPDADGRRGFDGRSLLDVLRGSGRPVHEVVFAQHTALGVYGVAGPLPTRAACDGRYKLIRNFNPGAPFMFDGWRTPPILRAWQADAQHDPALHRRLHELTHPPAEQLYDLDADPYELSNRADDPALAAVKSSLSAQIDRWMAQQGDRGMPTELDFARHMKSPGE